MSELKLSEKQTGFMTYLARRIAPWHSSGNACGGGSLGMGSDGSSGGTGSACSMGMGSGGSMGTGIGGSHGHGRNPGKTPGKTPALACTNI